MAGVSERPAAHLTRRGSLAYYLAAWVCGSFFFSLVRLLAQPKQGDPARALLMGFFISAAVAWPAMLLFAFLLRKSGRLFALRDAARWALMGSALAIVFGAAALPLQRMPAVALRWPVVMQARMFTLKGFSESGDSYGWTVNTLATAAAGMATAFTLFQVEKAFGAKRDASN